jgi:serine O-acetyltransferase
VESAEATFDTASGLAFEETLAFLGDSLGAGAPARFRPLVARAAADPRVREAAAEALAAFESDAARWRCRFDDPRALFDHLAISPNLAALYFYRLTHALFRRDVERLPDVLAAVARQATGVEIYYSARCGPAMKVIHGLGTVIGAGCHIGHHFTVYQGVTVGDRVGGATGLENRPVIGDYVIACTGATILGPVEIGDHTIIAAHSVVLDSLPPRCVAAGAPARVKVANVPDEKFQEYWASFRG